MRTRTSWPFRNYPITPPAPTPFCPRSSRSGRTSGARPALRKALSEQGFRLVQEEDNVRLWLAVDALRPWTAEQSVLVVSQRLLNTLPYDLWAEAHRIEISLAVYFPRLSLPIVRALTPVQRKALAQASEPPRRLGQIATLRHVLKHVFDADEQALREPGELLLWLNEIHHGLGPLPEPLSTFL